MTLKQDTDRINDEEASEIRKQAEEFLRSRYFYAAKDQYMKLLEYDPGDKEAHIGVLLCDNKTDDVEELIRYYQDLYSVEETELLLACDKEEEHIEEMCEKFCLPDYLEKSEIRKVYDFDLSYRSSVFCRKKQREEILKQIDGNVHLTWLKEKGQEEIKEILSAYDRRLNDAQQKDKENEQRIRNDYQRFLFLNYAKVKDLNTQAKQKKDEDYKELIHGYERSSDIGELRDLSFRFAGLRDYKEAERYVSLCEEKIDQLRRSQEDEQFKKVIDNSLTKARAALVTGKYDQANEDFTKIISMDPKNEEAYLGILMSQTKTTDPDELFRYFRDLYHEDKKETLEACEEDRSHIDEMAEKYHLPDYLDKETIRAKYSFDRTYTSHLKQRIEEEDRFKEEVEVNPAFLWLRKNGSKKVRDEIDLLYDTYSSRIAEAREEDRKKIEQIRNDYQRFLFKTYASIKKLYKDANEKKEETYRSLIRSFELAGTEKELQRLSLRFEDLGDYKDSRRYSTRCLSKIEDLKDRERKQSADQEVETTLIAARAYLSSGNTDLADQSFSRVLSLDPDNPQAYLGILMIETDTRNIDELVDYYARQFDEEESRTLEACKEDRKHIDAAVEKYEIPGYLDKDVIEKYYAFDRSYESLTASRVLQKEQFNEEVKMNPLLSKISDTKNSEVVSFFEKIRDVFDTRIADARAEDERQSSSIRHIYEVYLEESDKAVERIHEEKRKEKEADSEAVYRKNVAEFNKDLNEEELQILSGNFDKDYKDGAKYVRECEQRILNLRRNKEKNKLDQLYAEGTELLECRLFDDAKERFDAYLKIDPENEDVITKLLMAEKKAADVGSLFDQYKQLYLYDIPETKEAVKEDTEHIEEMCEKCCVPGELEKQEIRRRYRFDRTYPSLVNVRTVQKRQIEDEVRLDPLLSKLYRDGSDAIKARIKDLLETYEERLSDAMTEEEEKITSLRKEYKSFIRNTDREVRSLYNELIRDRNKRAKSAEKDRKEAERKLKEEAERQRLFEEASKKEEKKSADRQEEEKRLEKQRLKAEQDKKRREDEALARKERELRKEERRQKTKQSLQQIFKRKNEIPSVKTEDKKRSPIRIDPVPVMAAVSLIVLMAVVYLYVIVPGNKYDRALSLAEQGQFDEAIAVFKELGSYKDSDFQMKQTMYLKADRFYQDGDLVDAANAFFKLRFDDSEDRVKQIKDQLIAKADVGDPVLFGDYEQDGDSSNGKELIEWIVLAKEEGRLMLISRYGLDGREFSSQSGECYWEISTLRSWLNGRFPDNSFSNEDPSDVLQSTLINYRYPPAESEDEDVSELILEEYTTNDRVFLLDSQELNAYFPEESDRECKATEFAIENGVTANADNSCNWWLRSPGSERDLNEYVWNQYGTVSSTPQQIVLAVRPVMWIKNER